MHIFFFLVFFFSAFAYSLQTVDESLEEAERFIQEGDPQDGVEKMEEAQRLLRKEDPKNPQIEEIEQRKQMLIEKAKEEEHFFRGLEDPQERIIEQEQWNEDWNSSIRFHRHR